MENAKVKAKEERALQIAILTAAADAAFEPDESDSYLAGFDELVTNLGLDPEDRDVLINVIQGRRWRRAREPFEFVKSAVRRAPRNVEIVSIGDIAVPTGWEGGAPDDSDRLTLLALPNEEIEEREAVALWESEDSAPTGIHRVRSDLTIIEDPPEWMREWIADPRPAVRVDWREVGQRAGLDSWATMALQYLARGSTLYAAMQEQENDGDRKALRAGWKRLERRLQSGEIRKILEKTKVF